MKTYELIVWASGVLGSVMHVIAFLLVTVHCLWNRREPTSALLWIFVAWLFPVLGPLAFLSFGINRVPAKAWRKQQSDQQFLSERRAREDEAMALTYWRSVRESLAAEPTSAFSKELNDVMNRIVSDYPLLTGNSIEPLLCGDQAFPRMLQAIQNARHHIHLQTYILAGDAVGREFMEHLKKRAESGVTVRLLYDRFGSTHAVLTGLLRAYKNVPNLHLCAWRQASLIKRQFQLNLRNHRKLLVVDGETAFAGGINLHAENLTQENRPPVRDYHFELHGPIVQELQYSFLGDWYYMTDEDPEVLLSKDHFPRSAMSGDAQLRVINGGPTSEIETIAEVLFAVIGAARKQILAVTPYFVPPPDIRHALRAAALRGVDVRLVVPAKNNHVYAGLASRALYDSLLSAGVRILERRPPFIHAKALIVDDAVAVVGSTNLDARSLRLNYETNLVVYDESFINQLKRIVLEDVAASDEIDLTAWRRRPGWRRLAENLFNLFTPVL